MRGMGTLSHVVTAGTSMTVPRMVDITAKPLTARTATAEALVTFPAAVATAYSGSRATVDAVAITAATSAAKLTSSIIPFCHQIALTACRVEVDASRLPSLRITASASTAAGTGVEMEALTAVTVAALTVYDMCKAAGAGIEIHSVRLLKKTGGTSSRVTAAAASVLPPQ